MWADAQRDGRPAELVAAWRPLRKSRNSIPCDTIDYISVHPKADE